MTLLNDFFYMTSNEADEKGGITYHIRLNPAHIIFGAHFPGNPITPGVCQIGMVEELVSLQEGKRLRITGISNIKYMNTLTPTEHETFDIRISPLKVQDSEYIVQCVMSSPDCVFTKMSIKLK